MVSFENFVKSMLPSLTELKVTPNFCFPFKIPDDLTTTNVPVHCTAESWLVQSQGKLSMAKRAAVTKWIGHGPPSQKIDSFITSMFSFFPPNILEMCLVSSVKTRLVCLLRACAPLGPLAITSVVCSDRW